MKTYTKEQWWEECRRHKPDLSRYDFNARWDAVWTLAHHFGLVIPI